MLLVITLFAGAASAYKVPAYNGFVNDYSGKLSASQVQDLNDKVQAVNKQTANEIGVAVIKDLGDESIEDVTHQIYNTWHVGKAGLDNGALLVIAVNNRKMRIETGKGVEGDLTDLQTQDIQDHMKPYLRKGDLHGAIALAVTEIGSSIETRRANRKNGVATSSPTPAPAMSCQTAAPGSSHGAWFGLGLLAFFAAGVYLVFRIVRRAAQREQDELNERARREAQAYLTSQKKHLESVKKVSPIDPPAPRTAKKETLRYVPSYARQDSVAPSRKPASVTPIASKPKAKPAPRVETPTPAPAPTPSYDYSSSYSSSSSSSSYDSGSSSSGFDSGSFGGGDSGGGGSSSDW